MNNKTILITGGTSGIGRSVALMAGQRGHHVDVVGGTNEDKGKQLQQDFTSLPGTLRFFPVDLSSVESIKQFAESYLLETQKLDIAFLNAGFFTKKPKLNSDGYDIAFMVNYIHKFMLTVLLNPLLGKADGRVIINGGAVFAKSLKLEDDSFAKNYSPMSGAMQSSYANDFLNYWLNQKFNSGVPVQGLSPGFVKTNSLLNAGTIPKLLAMVFSISPDKAAIKIINIIEDDKLHKLDSAYFSGGKQKKFKSSITDKPDIFERLWLQSLKVSRIAPPEWEKQSA